MGDEKDAFYVVRKGDIIGIYKTFADCQAQAGFSPLDPSISVYKGYGLSKETEAYLVSRGLQQAGFSINACDVQDGLFGRLSVCPFQDAGESSCSALNAPNKPVKFENYADTPKISNNYMKPADLLRPSGDAGEPSYSAFHAPNKPVKLEDYVEPQASAATPACVATPNGRIKKHLDTGLSIFPSTCQQSCDKFQNYKKPVDRVRPSCVSAEPSLFIPNTQKKVNELKNYMEPQQLVHPATQSCTIEFDGASKGNPGQAGAGAILRAIDGSEVWLLREGVGIATNNVAEYRSVILGLRTALQKGFKHVKVRGDSMLVCNQIQGKWKTKNENMSNLCKHALLLKKQFLSFTIEHVPRECNSAADAQANRAIKLRDGQVEIEMAHA